MKQPEILYDDIYDPAVVMARVGHLEPLKRRQVEHITRIIRASFDPGGTLKPRPRIKRVVLIGEHARRDGDQGVRRHPPNRTRSGSSSMIGCLPTSGSGRRPVRKSTVNSAMAAGCGYPSRRQAPFEWPRHLETASSSID